MLKHRRGGYRGCPYCEEKVETRVLAKGYGQVPYKGALAKRRKVTCRKTIDGNPGCGQEWYTLEVPEELLGIDSSTIPKKKGRKNHG
jgi:hypothetical protein